jgi:hypothetical protein
VWDDVAMDFVEGIPCINEKSVILTVVHRLSKYSHFITLGHPYFTMTVARAFFDNIMCRHDIPNSIVSDCDAVFTSTFWWELFELTGVPPAEQRPVRDYEQDYNHVPPVSYRRSAMVVAKMATMVRVLL